MKIINNCTFIRYKSTKYSALTKKHPLPFKEVLIKRLTLR